MDEEKIFQAIAQLTIAVNKGFQSMEGRFESIEGRLETQEKKQRKAAKRQQLQAREIEELQKVVRSLAENAPLRKWETAAAIRKESAYSDFEKLGIGKVTAMRALEKAETIRVTKDGKRTPTIYLDGRCQRVIIVEMDGGDK